VKKTALIILCLVLALSIAACGKAPANPDLKTQFQYPQKFDLNQKYSMRNVVRDTNELYDAISKAYPGKPVLVLIRQSYSGNVYPLELNDALNTWLSDNGYGFSLMVYSFGNYGLSKGKTFEMQVREYVDAGGRCDIIAPGPNISGLAGIPGDTLWDYVNDGLIVPVDSMATEDQLKAVSDIYGEAFLKVNSDNGRIYGFSATTLEVSSMAGYLASGNGYGFPGEEPQSVRDIVFLNIAPEHRLSRFTSGRAYLDKIAHIGDLYSNKMALAATASVEGLINSVLLDESYTQINMLPLYVHETENGPEVLALWEVPMFEEIMQGYAEIVEEGYLSLNDPADSAMYYYFESYTDPKIAQKQLEKDAELQKHNAPRVVVPLSNIPSVTGPECSLFVASGSENKELALDFAISALTDKALGQALCMGLEGVSYTVENGVRTDLANPMDAVIYPNPLYRIPTEFDLENSLEIAAELQTGATFDLYENFNADFSDCREEALALSQWAKRYKNALWIFDAESTEAYGYNMRTFLEDPAYPDIEALRASVQRQLAIYEGIYR